MELYQFITPADPITFYAPDDKVAYACAVLIGRGKAGCERMNSNIKTALHTLVALYTDSEATTAENLGCSLDHFVETHKEEVSQALKTFAYVTPERRQEYDDACKAMHSPEALEAYRIDHEDRNRKSFNQLVLWAWKVAEIFESQPEEVYA